MDLQVFTTNGTWTKPDGAKYVIVRAVASGAGGGSGRRGVAGTDRWGGGGGAGGGISFGFFLASQLPNSIAVVVGQGGAGAPGIAVDNTDGTDGSPGEPSSFSPFVIASSGGGGFGGDTVEGLGGDTLFSADAGGRSTRSFGHGGIQSGAISSSSFPFRVAGGGGGGGGRIFAPNTPSSGAHGTFGSGRFPAQLNAGAAGVNGSVGNSVRTNEPFGGNGGGGGGSSAVAAAGSGANGGLYGGGGGGGGACVNGFLSGAGGAGADGIVVVETHF